MIYSLDASMVFDPYDLALDVTPVSVRQQLKKCEWSSAILLAFRLNESALIREVLEALPHEQSRNLFFQIKFLISFNPPTFRGTLI